MLTSLQLEQLAGAATQLRGYLEAGIMPAPTSAAAMIDFMRLSEGERASQTDLTAASAHLASVTALLHRAADRAQPIIEITRI